jgi:hypothetical protein
LPPEKEKRKKGIPVRQKKMPDGVLIRKKKKKKNKKRQ